MTRTRIIAALDDRRHRGLLRKYEQIREVLEKNGIQTDLEIFGFGLKSLIQGFLIIAFGNQKTLVLRHDLLFPFYVPALFISKFRSVENRIELPHPITSLLSEHEGGGAVSKLKTISLKISLLTIPRVASKILVYANEDNQALKGASKLIQLTSNGISFDAFAVGDKPRVSALDTSQLRLICVANLSRWHAVDRLLNALPGTDAKLVIVGNGVCHKELECTVEKLGIQSQVAFLGQLSGDALDAAFEGANCGVGSLGFHRIGLTSGSPIKTREYAARGLPVLAAYDDNAIPSDHDFPFLRVPSDESPIDLNWLVKSLQNVPGPLEVRNLGRELFDIKKTSFELAGIDI